MTTTNNKTSTQAASGEAITKPIPVRFSTDQIEEADQLKPTGMRRGTFFRVIYLKGLEQYKKGLLTL